MRVMMMKKMIIRMKKIFNLVKELSNKTDDEWVELYKKLKPILLYNRERLLKYIKDTDILSDNYLEKLKTLTLRGLSRKLFFTLKKKRRKGKKRIV